MIKSVIFDFGGVVVNEGFENWIQAYNVVASPSFKEQALRISPSIDRGTLPASAYTQLLGTCTNKTAQEVNREILLGYENNEDILQLIKKLRQEKIKIGLITNFPKEWFYSIFKRLSLAHYFDTISVSSVLHIIKPEAGIYTYTLTQLGVDPEESVFVDDNKTYVLGARDVGMHAIQYTEIVTLRNDLQQLGIAV